MPRMPRSVSRSNPGRRRSHAQPEPSLAPAVDRLLRQARGLHADPSPLQAETPAKSLVHAMMAEGVDLTDQRALDAWIEEYNARPIAERDAMLGTARGPGTTPAQPKRGPKRDQPRTAQTEGRGRPDDVAARRAWAVPPGRGTLRGIDLTFLDPAHTDDRSLLVEVDHAEFARALRRHEDVDVDGATVNPRLHLALHEIVANQLWDDQPPRGLGRGPASDQPRLGADFG